MSRRCVVYVLGISLLLLAIAGGADSETTRCQVLECPNSRTIRYYEQLGCVRSDGSSDCCPTRFNCSFLQSLDKTKCHYRGKTIEPGKDADSDLACNPPCMCISETEATSGEEARFYCPPSKCPVPAWLPPEKESYCYRTTSLDSCCDSTGVRCVNDSDSPQKATECPYKGKTYREDEYMSETLLECKECVCQTGFDGTLDGPWCKDVTCDYLTNHRISKLQKCTPVLRENVTCCATRFQCPSPGDTVIRHSESTTENEGQQCSFGEHRLEIGDELQPLDHSCVTCKCEVPPFITCKRRAVPECNTNYL